MKIVGEIKLRRKVVVAQRLLQIMVQAAFEDFG